MKESAASLVADAIAKLDSRPVVVGGHRYIIHPPTIATLARAGSHIAQYPPSSGNIADTLRAITELPHLADALSVFIKGDESLSEVLQKGTLTELADALSAAYSLLDPRPFLTAVTLSRNVAKMIANTPS